MSIVTLTVQVMAVTGITPTYGAAAADGNDFVNDGRTFLQVKNSGASTTVTVDSPTLCDQGEAHDVTVTVGATTGDKMIGPFNPKRFNSSAGKVTATYSQVTGITVAAIQFVNTG